MTVTSIENAKATGQVIPPFLILPGRSICGSGLNKEAFYLVQGLN